MRRPFTTRKVAAVLAGALSCLAAGSSPPAEGNKDPDQNYAMLLTHAKADPEKADFGQLRLSFAASSHYEPYPLDVEENKAINAAMEKGDFAGALRGVDKLLDKDYVNIEAHFLAASLCRKLGDQNRLDFHHKFLGGLIGSILKSGNGESYDSAFRVIDVREEYVILQMLKLKDGRQSLRSQDGHEFDVFTFEGNAKEKARTVYFNIDIPRRALKRRFGSR